SGKATLKVDGSRSIRSHMRRVTLGQSTALCIAGAGRSWHWPQYLARAIAPGDWGEGRSAGAIPGGGRAIFAAANRSSSRGGFATPEGAPAPTVPGPG